MSSAGTEPLVSVIIATYNRAALVQRAVESALAQTYSRLEVVVSDDCSPDQTFELLTAISDPRVSVHRQPTNIGVWNNWTAALRRAQGDFLIFLGDDDWLSQNFVSRHLEALTEDPTLAATFSPMTEVTNQGKSTRRFVPRFTVGARATGVAFLKSVLACNLFFGAAVFRRSSAVDFWDQTQADDWVADVGLMLRMALASHIEVSAVEGCEYYKTMSEKSAAHEQLSGHYLKVTGALQDVILRVLPLSQSVEQTRLLCREGSSQGIVLARHHAAAGDFDACKRLLWKSARLEPSHFVVWSQLFQAFFCPARLAQTSRDQRGLPQAPGL